ncbi:MAG: pyruvate, phosphate dikinase [Planctomycetes bacterium]|nr:pyruvate, phosphate dikinase [Planctomycetota bacterium]
MSRSVYFFERGKADGDARMKQVLGGKGANLAEMCRIGLPVPPGFTIGTAVCAAYYENGERLPDPVRKEVDEHLGKLEAAMERRFGAPEAPLFVSVRSGAAISMPGMMDTVLNLGLNEATLEGLAKSTGNRRFALDAYRRLVHMFGDVVMGVPHEEFEEALSDVKARRRAVLDTDLDEKGLEEVVKRYLGIYEKHVKAPFPQDPREQLARAIEAVFRSWNADRARKYREIHGIKGLLGTAVNVQAMVFGNLGATSGTGVCFTRDPSTGENVFYGEYLVNAQGEDVVAGIRTPEPIALLGQEMPDVYRQLLSIKDTLERHYKEMQDLEFTVQDGVLYMLQTRTGKRTAQAAVRIAVEMADEGLIDEKEALRRVDPAHLDRLLHPTFDPGAEKVLLSRGGLPASPGAVSGRIVFTADEAESWASRGEKVILVRRETSPEDIGGMHAAQGILTALGGMTSHAAVVARGMGKCCVAGCGDAQIDAAKRTLTFGGRTLREGDWISLDGSSGEVMLGRVKTMAPKPGEHFGRLMAMADRHRRLRVRTNADTPHDAKVAREFGAEGIGLCRTEHMFFEETRITAVREMILAENVADRERALAKLLPEQRKDFLGIFKAMDGLPVTIRLLDPPLHEFVPHDTETRKKLADGLKIPVERVERRCKELEEFNPMLGHRGCRLMITFPEIIEMQGRAIAEAACDAARDGVHVIPEVMIPLVGAKKELDYCVEKVRAVVEKTLLARGAKVPFLFGTMIEVPRAALLAREIAGTAEFFSFGTNDLTQMTFAFSRDDAGRFLADYLAKEILEKDPFQTLDTEGVGKLVRMAVADGRAARPKLKLGICGEHGGDPASIAFCHEAGLDYVSCSPYRVPIARLAAARAALTA